MRVRPRAQLAGGERPFEPVDLRQADLLVALGDDRVGRRQQRPQRARRCFRVGGVAHRAHDGDARGAGGDDVVDRLVASMPPIANHGTRSVSRAARTSSSPPAATSRFVGVP